MVVWMKCSVLLFAWARLWGGRVYKVVAMLPVADLRITLYVVLECFLSHARKCPATKWWESFVLKVFTKSFVWINLYDWTTCESVCYWSQFSMRIFHEINVTIIDDYENIPATETSGIWYGNFHLRRNEWIHEMNGSYVHVQANATETHKEDLCSSMLFASRLVVRKGNCWGQLCHIWLCYKWRHYRWTGFSFNHSITIETAINY